MTKLISLMSFYDESEDFLNESFDAFSRLGVTTVVAVDGAYARFPDGRARSQAEVTDQVGDLARMLDLALLLYQPREVWEDNEVGKRQFMIDLALSIAKPVRDWFVVWDCDYKLLNVPTAIEKTPTADEIVEILSHTTEDFATISFTESREDNAFNPMQMFIRAQKVTMDGNHHTYLLDDGRRSQILRRPVENMADAADLGSIKVRHRCYERDDERLAKQAEWYRQRDEFGLET